MLSSIFDEFEKEKCQTRKCQKIDEIDENS